MSAQYTLDANGNLTLPGVLFSNSGGPGTGTGTTLPLSHALAPTGIPMTASSGSGFFGMNVTAGTAVNLKGEAANNSTTTDVFLYEYVLPGNFNTGSNINVNVNINYNLSASAVLSVSNVSCAVYVTNANGSQGASIVTAGTATQAFTATAANYTFVCTGTTLAPSTRLMLKVTAVLTETASHNAIAYVNSLSVS
jgi:hypothetical protein